MAGGFMSGLSGLSTAGAFVGGAAKQINENIESSNAQARQDDLLHIALAQKADAGIDAYNKTNDQNKSKAGFYSVLLQAAGGDSRLADTAYKMWDANPGLQKDPTAIFNTIQATLKNPNYKSPDTDYKSDVLPNIGQSSQNAYGNAQTLAGRAGPKYQGIVKQPNAPYQQPAQPQSQTTQAAAPMATDTDDTSVGTPATNPTPATPPTPGFDPNNPNSPQGKNFTTPAGVPDTTGQDVAPGASNTGITPTAPTSVPNTGAGFTFAPKTLPKDQFKPKVLGPADFSTPEQYNTYIQSGGKDTSGVMSGTDKKPAKADPVAIKDNENYLNDPKTGLAFRVANLNKLNTQNWNLQLMEDTLNRGFSASKVQPMLDELNRFTQPALGIDLNSIGANNIQDVNTLKKTVSAAILNQLQTYHFGRILQKEVDLTQQSLVNSGGDANTNAKILLLAKAGNDLERGATMQEDMAAHPNGANVTTDSIASARKLRQEYLSQHGDSLPWVKADASNLSQILQKAQPGQWIENSATGAMYNVLPDRTLRPAGAPVLQGTK